MTGKFLTAEWRHVAMLNYEVDPAVLAPHVPRGTELDAHRGRHFVSLVGFLFLDTHVLGLPALFHQNFEEVNLRFYVRRSVGEETRSGVVFLREMVPLTLVTESAKLPYNEPYRTVPIQHTLVETNGKLQSVEFLFGRPREQCRLALHLDGLAREIQRGSDEEFCPFGIGATPNNATAAPLSIASSTRDGRFGPMPAASSMGRWGNSTTSHLLIYSQVCRRRLLSPTDLR